jgi:6-phosphofructokinase
MSRKNLIVGQSGGPTAVINSSLYGVVSEGMRHPEAIEHVYGMINGIEGFLNGTVLDFAEALPGEKLDGLKSHQVLILVPAAINCRNHWKIRFIQDFLKNLKK